MPVRGRGKRNHTIKHESILISCFPNIITTWSSHRSSEQYRRVITSLMQWSCWKILHMCSTGFSWPQLQKKVPSTSWWKHSAIWQAQLRYYANLSRSSHQQTQASWNKIRKNRKPHQRCRNWILTVTSRNWTQSSTVWRMSGWRQRATGDTHEKPIIRVNNMASRGKYDGRFRCLQGLGTIVMIKVTWGDSL